MTEKDETLIAILYGHCELRAWFEAEIMPDGSLRLVGMGSRTDYDREGRCTGTKTEPTGVVATL